MSNPNEEGEKGEQEGVSQYRTVRTRRARKRITPVNTALPDRSPTGGAGSGTEPIATRVIDENGTVVSQNGVMTEWTGTNANREDVACNKQLSVPFCGTEDCIYEQLVSEDAEWIEAETEVELSSGESKPVHLVAEEITNDAGKFVGIAESFKDISSLVEASEENPWTGSPKPTDEASFREALCQLFAEASSNNVPVSNRSWKCESEETDQKWDVEIAKLVGTE